MMYVSMSFVLWNLNTDKILPASHPHWIAPFVYCPGLRQRLHSLWPLHGFVPHHSNPPERIIPKGVQKSAGAAICSREERCNERKQRKKYDSKISKTTMLSQIIVPNLSKSSQDTRKCYAEVPRHRFSCPLHQKHVDGCNDSGQQCQPWMSGKHSYQRPGFCVTQQLWEETVCFRRSLMKLIRNHDLVRNCYICNTLPL